MEGEMVKDQNHQWVFLINDMLLYKGRYLKDEPLPKRIQHAYDMLEHHYTSDNWMDVCQYQVKKYYECSQSAIEEMIMMSRDMPYTNRGIYFMPYSMKWKPKLIKL